MHKKALLFLCISFILRPCGNDSVEARGCCRHIFAVWRQVFPWSECLVHETGDKSLYNRKRPPEVETTCGSDNSAGQNGRKQDTHGEVYSHRLSYLETKVRKGGDFFYGKSGNENHIEGV